MVNRPISGEGRALGMKAPGRRSPRLGCRHPARAPPLWPPRRAGLDDRLIGDHQLPVRDRLGQLPRAARVSVVPAPSAPDHGAVDRDDADRDAVRVVDHLRGALDADHRSVPSELGRPVPSQRPDRSSCPGARARSASVPHPRHHVGEAPPEHLVTGPPVQLGGLVVPGHDVVREVGDDHRLGDRAR